MTDVYGPLNGASAIAANGIFRYTLGAVFPLFTVQSECFLTFVWDWGWKQRSSLLTSCAVYSALGVSWATSLLGFLSVLMLPIPWVFYKWGPRIRARSRYPVVM